MGLVRGMNAFLWAVHVETLSTLPEHGAAAPQRIAVQDAVGAATVFPVQFSFGAVTISFSLTHL